MTVKKIQKDLVFVEFYLLYNKSEAALKPRSNHTKDNTEAWSSVLKSQFDIIHGEAKQQCPDRQ